MSATRTCPQCGSSYEHEIKFCPIDGSTLRSPPGSDLIGTIIADRYHVLGLIGEGAMGRVYLAEHVKMGRRSAIKVMHPQVARDAEAIGRFNREAANASRISHTNVCAIYDFGETLDGLIYLAMEYVDGESLTALLGRLGTIAPARAAEITRQAADALDAAHDLGIVHRDLKPDNIMIARGRDGADLVKVVDFGIAKSRGGSEQQFTRTGFVVGTPEYMSPEQLSGDELDGRSDTYALALVSFHMLTGQLPFPSPTQQESMLLRLTERPRTLIEMCPGVDWPAHVQQVLDRALARFPADRYQRASHYARDLIDTVAEMDVTHTSEMGTQLVPPSATAPVRTPGAAARAPAPGTRRPGGSTRPLPPARARVRGGSAADAGASEPGGAPWRRRAAWGATGVLIFLVGIGAWATRASHRGARAPMRADSSRVPAGPAAPGQPVGQRVDTMATENRAGTLSARHEAPASAEPYGVDESRATVRRAAALIEQHRPDRALVLLRAALQRLPTASDSITAYYHMSEALLQRAKQRNDERSRTLACQILGRLAPVSANHELARSIRYLSEQECS